MILIFSAKFTSAIFGGSQLASSAGEIPADDELIVNAAVVEFVTGSGRKAITDIDNDLLCKRAIVKIRNTDYSCLPRAIVVGYKHLMTKLSKDQESLKVYNRIRDYRCSLQRIEATNLRQGVVIPDNRFGTIEDIYLYEDFLQVGIVVISARAGNRKVYLGSPKYENKIFLYHLGLPGKGHFDTVVKVNYCVNNTIVTNVTKVSKVEQVTNVMYGVMCVEEKTVRKKRQQNLP